MKKIISHSLALVVLTWIFSSCGITPIENNQTIELLEEKSAEEIEREKVLEQYRLMRARNWDKLQKNKKAQNYKKVVITPRPVTPVKPKIISVPIDDQKIEIEQNQAYFCMKRKAEHKFSNEEECVDFTTRLLDECLEEYEYGDARLTRCVKSRLVF